ncbi:MAG: hypothetical protein GDA55_03180 [Cellvibrionales bacterium]|nr:hypothetical protein [Cellvibrionales bacterium]
MMISDWIMIIVVLLGPIVAVQLTKYLDAKREKQQRKLDIFKKLMSTRAYTVSWDHVMALNLIDLEFNASKPKEKAVISAWKQYHVLLGNRDISAEQWQTRRVDLLVELLHKMAVAMNYDFDKTHIKNSSYAPQVHGHTETQWSYIRQGIIDILDGKRPFPMHITNWPDQDQQP